MPVLNITGEQIEQARTLGTLGKLSEAWELLGRHGDAYAYLASAILADTPDGMSGIARLFYEGLVH